MAVQEQLSPGEHIFAFLDDVYALSDPERTSAIYKLLEETLFATAGIWSHIGKTRTCWVLVQRRCTSHDPPASLPDRPLLIQQVENGLSRIPLSDRSACPVCCCDQAHLRSHSGPGVSEVLL